MQLQRRMVEARSVLHFRNIVFHLLVVVIFVFPAVSGAQAQEQASGSTLVTMDIRDGDLRETFLKLADRAKLNVLVSPKVRGNVTFRVTDMEPLELIQFLARANGLELEKHGSILLILADDTTPPSRVRFEVIPLQNAKAEEVAKIIQNLKLDKHATVTHDSRTNRLLVIYPE